MDALRELPMQNLMSHSQSSALLGLLADLDSMAKDAQLGDLWHMMIGEIGREENTTSLVNQFCVRIGEKAHSMGITMEALQPRQQDQQVKKEEDCGVVAAGNTIASSTLVYSFASMMKYESNKDTI